MLSITQIEYFPTELLQLLFRKRCHSSIRSQYCRIMYTALAHACCYSIKKLRSRFSPDYVVNWDNRHDCSIVFAIEWEPID